MRMAVPRAQPGSGGGGVGGGLTSLRGGPRQLRVLELSWANRGG